MPDLKIAAVYIRVSTDDQTELSPDSQLEAIRAWAEKNACVIPDAHVYVDEGISGRSAAKRPRFMDMIGAAKSAEHPFDVILVWKFSRFARSQEESIVYKAMLQKAGVDVISISEPVIDGPFGSLIERIIEWMDEYYSIRLSGEVKRSMTVNAQRGVLQTAPPFGYKKNPAGSPAMIPDGIEADVIREVFRDYLAGVPVWQIVERLNARGIRTHRGGLIENRTIMYWLQNPVYVGMLRWTPSGRTRRDFHNPDSVIVPGDHEPLISREIFDAVQSLVAAASEAHRPKSRPSFELKDWASGVVRCAHCGSTLVFQRPRYFICNGYVRARCKERNSITVDTLHSALLEKLRADSAGAHPLRYEITRSDDAERELRALRQQAEQYDRRRKRIHDAYVNGLDSMDDYRRYKAALDAQQKELLDKIADLESRVDPSAAEAVLTDSIRAALEILESPDATLYDKNTAAKELFESVTWDKSANSLTVVYRVFLSSSPQSIDNTTF